MESLDKAPGPVLTGQVGNDEGRDRGRGGGCKRQGESTGEAVLTVLWKACRWCERRGADVGERGLWTGFFMGTVYENRKEVWDI